MPTSDDLINAYVIIRDQKKELTDRHKQEMAPFNEKLTKLEAGLLSQLNAAGGESIRCKAGTAYRIERTSVKVDDWDKTLPFVLEHGLEHLLVKNLSKAGVTEYIEANGEAPPGVAITVDAAIGVRRK
jgi:hypothetical protein